MISSRAVGDPFGDLDRFVLSVYRPNNYQRLPLSQDPLIGMLFHFWDEQIQQDMPQNQVALTPLEVVHQVAYFASPFDIKKLVLGDESTYYASKTADNAYQLFILLSSLLFLKDHR